MPPKLHQRLKAAAVYNGRSLNAEIVQRLRRSLESTSVPRTDPSDATAVDAG
jgi:plasmid stability protein